MHMLLQRFRLSRSIDLLAGLCHCYFSCVFNATSALPYQHSTLRPSLKSLSPCRVPSLLRRASIQKKPMTLQPYPNFLPEKHWQLMSLDRPAFLLDRPTCLHRDLHQTYLPHRLESDLSGNANLHAQDELMSIFSTLMGFATSTGRYPTCRLVVSKKTYCQFQGLQTKLWFRRVPLTLRKRFVRYWEGTYQY